MKTTVELPSSLLRRAKAIAALEERSLKELFIEALEERLRHKRPRGRGWRSVFGRADRAAISDIDERLADLERVAPEDWE